MTINKFVKYIDENTVEYPPKNDLEQGILNYDLDEELLLEDGYLPLNDNEKPTETKVVAYYTKKNDKVILHYKEQSDGQLASQIRAKRNNLLTTTDWTLGNDSPLSDEQKEAYRVYRQALRDITKQEDFPHHVDWPIISEV